MKFKNTKALFKNKKYRERFLKKSFLMKTGNHSDSNRSIHDQQTADPSDILLSTTSNTNVNPTQIPIVIPQNGQMCYINDRREGMFAHPPSQ